MADKIVRARVVGSQPYYGQDGVLYHPGEIAPVNLTKLGVDSLDDPTVVGLEAVSKNAEELIEQAPVAAVAPHAPDAPRPQGIPTGSVESGTGRILVPERSSEDGAPQAIEPVGADKPGVAGEQTPQKPTKSK